MLALLLHGCAAAVKTIKVTVPLSAPTSGVTGFTSVPINGKTVGMFTGTTSGAFMTTVCKSLVRYGTATRFDATIQTPGLPDVKDLFTVVEIGGCGAPNSAGVQAVLKAPTGSYIVMCGPGGNCSIYASGPSITAYYNTCTPKTKKCRGCYAACKCCTALT